MYDSPAQVIQIDTIEQHTAINLPGMIPSYTNLNNIDFTGNYHVRNYRFPANYYNFFPGDQYTAIINIQAMSNESSAPIMLSSGQFVIWQTSTYQQMNCDELVQAFCTGIRGMLDKPLGDNGNLTVMQKLFNQTAEYTVATQLQKDGVDSTGVPTKTDTLMPTSIVNADNALFADETACLIFDRLCQLAYDKLSNKIVLNYQMVNNSVITVNNTIEIPDLSNPNQGLFRQYTYTPTYISIAINVPTTLAASTQSFLKRAAGILDSKQSALFEVSSQLLERGRYQYQNQTVNAAAGYALNSFLVSVPIYNTLMSNMWRHQQIVIRTTMQSNMWNVSGTKQNILRVLPFSGEPGSNACLSHIEATNTPSHVEISDLRHAELEVCDENGSKIFFLEPYHIELGVVFKAVKTDQGPAGVPAVPPSGMMNTGRSFGR